MTTLQTGSDATTSARDNEPPDHCHDQHHDSPESAQPGVDDVREADPITARIRRSWSTLLIFGLLPILLLALALFTGWLGWQDRTAQGALAARVASVQSARDASVALLSYRPDTVDQQLGAARDLLTGTFKDAYTRLTHDVVIPGAKQKQISAVATVTAAGSVSASADHAQVLVFIDQTVIVGDGAPTGTTSAVRVTLDKVRDGWLVSGFDPV